MSRGYFFNYLKIRGFFNNQFMHDPDIDDSLIKLNIHTEQKT